MNELPLDEDKRLPTLSKSGEEIKEISSTEPEVSENFFSFFHLSSYDIPVCTDKQCNESPEDDTI